jgi:hypothetical protein
MMYVIIFAIWIFIVGSVLRDFQEAKLRDSARAAERFKDDADSDDDGIFTGNSAEWAMTCEDNYAEEIVDIEYFFLQGNIYHELLGDGICTGNSAERAMSCEDNWDEGMMSPDDFFNDLLGGEWPGTGKED